MTPFLRRQRRSGRVPVSLLTSVLLSLLYCCTSLGPSAPSPRFSSQAAASGESSSAAPLVSLKDVAALYREGGQPVFFEGSLLPGDTSTAAPQTLQVDVSLTSLDAFSALKAFLAEKEPSEIEDFLLQQIPLSLSSSASFPLSFFLRADVFASAPPLLFARVEGRSDPAGSAQGFAQVERPAERTAAPKVLEEYDGASVCSWLSRSSLKDAPHIFATSLLVPLSLSFPSLAAEKAALSPLLASASAASEQKDSKTAVHDEAQQAKGARGAPVEDADRKRLAELLQQALKEADREAQTAAASPTVGGWTEPVVPRPVQLSLSEEDIRAGSQALVQPAKTLSLAVSLPLVTESGEKELAPSRPGEGDSLLASVNRAFGLAASAGQFAPQKVLLVLSLLPSSPGLSGLSTQDAKDRDEGAKRDKESPQATVSPACAHLGTNPTLVKSMMNMDWAAATSAQLPAGRGPSPVNEVYVQLNGEGAESGAGAVDVSVAPDARGMALVHLEVGSNANAGAAGDRNFLAADNGRHETDTSDQDTHEARDGSTAAQPGTLVFAELDDASPAETPQVLICLKAQGGCRGIFDFLPPPFQSRGALPAAYRASLVLYQQAREAAATSFFSLRPRRQWLLPLCLLPAASGDSAGPVAHLLLLFPPSTLGEAATLRFGALLPRVLGTETKDTRVPASPSATPAPRDALSPFAASPSASPSPSPSPSPSSLLFGLFPAPPSSLAGAPSAPLPNAPHASLAPAYSPGGASLAAGPASPSALAPPAAAGSSSAPAVGSPASSPSPAPSQPPSFFWLLLLFVISSAAMLTAIKLVLYMDSATRNRPGNSFLLPSLFPVELESGSRRMEGAEGEGDPATGAAVRAAPRFHDSGREIGEARAWQNLALWAASRESDPTPACEKNAEDQTFAFPLAKNVLERPFRCATAASRLMEAWCTDSSTGLEPRESGAARFLPQEPEEGLWVRRGAEGGCGGGARGGDDLVCLPSREKKAKSGGSQLLVELQETTQKSFNFLSSLYGAGAARTAQTEFSPQALRDLGLKLAADTTPPSKLWGEGADWSAPGWSAVFPSEDEKDAAEGERGTAGAEARDASAAAKTRGGADKAEAALFDTLFTDLKGAPAAKKPQSREMEPTRTGTWREKESLASTFGGDEHDELSSFSDLTPSFYDPLATPSHSGAWGAARAERSTPPCFADEAEQPLGACAAVFQRNAPPSRAEKSPSSADGASAATRPTRGGGGRPEGRAHSSREESEREEEEEGDTRERQSSGAHASREAGMSSAPSLLGCAEGPETQRLLGEVGDEEGGAEMGAFEASQGGDCLAQDRSCRTWRAVAPLGDPLGPYEVTYRGDSALVEVATTEADEDDDRSGQERLLLRCFPDEL
ncbi:hypothetical protein BESB_031370 [Besnoitia besnoiti]|uniref:Transmembrane protein n=1 Tax=Besnoitia besnoiti TaxID=94643 RepID=A0A2A9M6J6_BESBE|nr:hypothetical protein BESB_031370 [Besnoitia besnoiti]PFH31263.1 hypothetical protein BESB_031370 [Besnoitia besnoiti]